MKEKCSRCQRKFQCHVEKIEICHCTQIVLSPMEANELRKQFSGCLCPTCLQQMKELSRSPRKEDHDK